MRARQLLKLVPTSQYRKTSRRGLTLLELVVVLAILAAVAAILVPLLPNLLRRAHKATDATQTSELAKAVQLYQAAFFSYPDRLDLLTDGSKFPSYVPTDSGSPFGGYVKAEALDPEDLAALHRAGINEVQPLATDSTPSGFHPTLHPYDDTKGTLDVSGTGTTGTKFAVLDTTKITNHLLESERESDPTAKFVVFGVGPKCTLVGQGIQDAPTSVPQNKDMTPDSTYCRVGVVFKVAGKEVARTERARFVAAVALEDDELEATEKDIIGYYEVSRDQRQP